MVVKDCPEFFYLFWGAIKAGLIPVPVNTLARTGDYRYMVELSGYAAVIYSPEFSTEVEPALSDPWHQPIFNLKVEGEGSVQSLMDTASSFLAPAPASADGDCFWLYSSGSTGRTKGAVHQHRDMVATCVHYAVNTFGMGRGDICFSAA